MTYLLTTVLHELAHLYRFIDDYSGFDGNVETENGITKFIGDDFEAIIDGKHLDKEVILAVAENNLDYRSDIKNNFSNTL